MIIGRLIGSLILGSAACIFLVGEAAAAHTGKVKGLDAKLGVRFLSSVKAGMPTGSRVDAVVTDPSKLKGLGLSAVKQGDRVTLTKGQGDSFSVQLAGLKVPMAVMGDGSVRRQALKGDLPAIHKVPPPTLQTPTTQK